MFVKLFMRGILVTCMSHANSCLELGVQAFFFFLTKSYRFSEIFLLPLVESKQNTVLLQSLIIQMHRRDWKSMASFSRAEPIWLQIRSQHIQCRISPSRPSPDAAKRLRLGIFQQPFEMSLDCLPSLNQPGCSCTSLNHWTLYRTVTRLIRYRRSSR